MTANALSVLFTANGGNHKPTIRAPKQLPILIQDSFRFILRVNIDNMPLRLLSKHLKDALVSNASFLDISSSVSSPEDHVLLGANKRHSTFICAEQHKVEPRKPHQGIHYLPYAVLDYIILDYRFSHLSATFEDTIGSTSTRDEGLFLPLRELLDQVVQRFVAQLVRQLPEAFGSWKDVCIAGETVLARHAARHLDNVLSLSTQDEVFQRKLQKQIKRIDRCLRSTKEELAADLSQHIPVAVDEESDSEALDIRNLLPFAVQTTYKQNVRPKRFKPLVTPSRIPLDLLDDPDPSPLVSSQDTLVSTTTTLSDDETLQLDSPLFPASPASSIQEGDLYNSPILSISSFSLESPPPVANSQPNFEPGDRTRYDDLNNDGDLGLGLDSDSDGVVDYDYASLGAEVGTADGGEFDADAWIDLEFAHGGDRPTMHQSISMTEKGNDDSDVLLYWDEDGSTASVAVLLEASDREYRQASMVDLVRVAEVVCSEMEEADADAFGFGDGDAALLDLD